jgi:SAM-dependent methyltransferase
MRESRSSVCEEQGGLLLAADDRASVIPALRELGQHLMVSGYQRATILPMPGGVLDLCFDPVNAARAVRGQPTLLHRSAVAGGFAAALGVVAPRAVALHRLFFLGRSMPAKNVRAVLGGTLTATLLEAGVLCEHAVGLRSRVLAAPYAGGVYFSDPTALQNHKHYCYLGRSTFTTVDYLTWADWAPPRQGRPTRLLDLACGAGAGAGAVASAGAFDEVVGTNIVERCLRFARVNAAVNDVRHASFHYSDVFSHIAGDFDLIMCNAPCVWADAEPDHFPRTYASGGGNFGLELPARIISGALDHLRPGGLVLAVIMAPVVHRKPYARRFFERLCVERDLGVTLYPLLAEYEWRNARMYRGHGISRMVRYLAVIDPAARVGVSFGRYDSARLLSSRLAPFRRTHSRCIAGSGSVPSRAARKRRFALGNGSAACPPVGASRASARG